MSLLGLPIGVPDPSAAKLPCAPHDLVELPRVRQNEGGDERGTPRSDEGEHSPTEVRLQVHFDPDAQPANRREGEHYQQDRDTELLGSREPVAIDEQTADEEKGRENDPGSKRDKVTGNPFAGAGSSANRQLPNTMGNSGGCRTGVKSEWDRQVCRSDRYYAEERKLFDVRQRGENLTALNLDLSQDSSFPRGCGKAHGLRPNGVSSFRPL